MTSNQQEFREAQPDEHFSGYEADNIAAGKDKWEDDENVPEEKMSEEELTQEANRLATGDRD